MSLKPNKRPWGEREAAHLLNRAGFGATGEDIALARERGLEATVGRLLELQGESDSFEMTAAILRRSAVSADNIATLKSWWFYRMVNSANPLREKMALFWHNHFATSWAKVQSVDAMAAQNDLFRRSALSSFEDLVTEVSRDVAMLEWLDSNSNRKRHPNENFARELMELFTLGVGNYSESDIREAARAFTGWHVKNGEFWFHKAQHDAGEKTVFGESGALGGDDIVRLCLKKRSCPEFLASKLLRAFVCPKPKGELVAALSESISRHGYHMAPVLGELFSSQVFYAPENRANLIKSPAELVAGTARTLGMRAKPGECVSLMADLGQNLFEPPTVKGWEGGRLWINSASMLQRVNFGASVASGDRFGRVGTDLPEQTERLAALLLPAKAPREVLDAAEGQSPEGRLQLLMSLPEYQLL